MNYNFDEFEINKFSAKALRNIQYFRNNYAIK